MKQYILVRKDIPKNNQIAQACHAVAGFMNTYRDDQ